MAPTYTGSCKCGSIKIELQGEPSMIALCHCHNCRKSTSSTYSTNAIYTKPAFTLASGEPKAYEAKGGSGNPVSINFCGNCSSTMWTATPSRPDMIVVKVGVLDGDVIDKWTPKMEMFTSRRPGWVGCVEGAGQFEMGFQAEKPQ